MPKLTVRRFLQELGRVMTFLALALMACFIIILVLLELWSCPGKPRPFLDENGIPCPRSISEKVFVNINRMQQGMFIKSKDTANPVLLYLHGGMPEYFLTRKYPIRLEEHFTVVWWEQRGSGLSYTPAISSATMTAEQFISDVFAVTDYLRRRFGKEKIFLMAHCGGTFIGIQAAARRPQLYYAYIGIAQMSNQLKSEKIAYDYMLNQFKEKGNALMVRKLEAAPVSWSGPVPKKYLSVRDEAMHRLGVGTTRDMRSVLGGIFLQSLKFPEYTLAEKINLWRSKARSSVAFLWNEMITTDLAKSLTEVSLPVYFFHGRYDYTVCYEEAKSYFDGLRAPKKGFYSFEQSAHSPLFEEPDKTMEVMLNDVLAGTTDLADSAGTGTRRDSR